MVEWMNVTLSNRCEKGFCQPFALNSFSNASLSDLSLILVLGNKRHGTIFIILTLVHCYCVFITDYPECHH